MASLTGAVGGAGLVIAAFIGNEWTVLALLIVTLSPFGLMSANAMAGALGVEPQRAGSTSALIGSASLAVGALAATVAGAFHDGTSRPTAIVRTTALVGTALALRTLALPSRFA